MESRTSILVSWTLPQPECGDGVNISYRVRYYKAAVPREELVSTTESSYLVAGLTPNTEYVVNVVTLSDYGISNPVHIHTTYSRHM